MMSRALQTVFAVLVLALVSACATPLEATMDFDSAYDFSKVRKVAIQPVEREALSAIHVCR